MKKGKDFFNLLFSKWWIRHLAFWIIMINYMAWGFGFIKSDISITYLRSFSLLAGSLLVVYPLLYLLIPKFLVKRKFFLFFAAFLTLLFFAGILTRFIDGKTGWSLTYKAWYSSWGNQVLPYVNICGIASSLYIIRYAFFQETKAQFAIHEQSLAELELLKAQIHPHFLFNTLNNLYSHTRRNSSESSKIVLTLSDLLRFMLYESRADFIPLTQEIQLLKNYVELEKSRFGVELDVSLTFSGDLEGKLIRPLLLLPLLENSFKHGTGDQLDQKWISLDLNVEKNQMHFKLANSRDHEWDNKEMSINEKGISLENVKRRLELLYPEEHNLVIKEEPDLFLVKLDLKLKKDVNVKSHNSLSETKTHDLESSTGR